MGAPIEVKELDLVVCLGHLGRRCACRPRGEQSGGALRHSIIDQEDGRIVRQHVLAQLNESWWQRRCCEITTLGDGYVAVMSGLILAGDMFGNVRWIRRSTVLSSSEVAFGSSLVVVARARFVCRWQMECERFGYRPRCIASPAIGR